MDLVVGQTYTLKDGSSFTVAGVASLAFPVTKAQGQGIANAAAATAPVGSSFCAGCASGQVPRVVFEEEFSTGALGNPGRPFVPPATSNKISWCG